MIGKNELLKFRVDYDNADITLKAADAGLKKSVNVLSRQVGSEIGLADLDFADIQTLPPLVDRADYVDKMLAARSEIKGPGSGVHRRRFAQAEVAKKRLLPPVGRGGQLPAK